MPTRAHSEFYWPGDGIENGGGSPAVVDEYGFPHWFNPAAVSFLGFGQFKLPVPRTRFWFERPIKKLKGLVIKLTRKLPIRWHVAYRVATLICSSDFGKAVQVTKEVAADPGSRNLKFWADIDRLAVSNPIHGENTYRNLLARVKMGSTPNSALLLELAWSGVKAKHG